MKLYSFKIGCALLFIFAIFNLFGLRQSETKIHQLDSTARILTTHAEAVQAAQEQPTLNAAAASTLTRADTQIAIASFSNENVAGLGIPRLLRNLQRDSRKQKSGTYISCQNSFGIPVRFYSVRAITRTRLWQL